MRLSINRRKSSWLSSCLNLEESVHVWTHESENDSLLSKTDWPNYPAVDSQVTDVTW